MRIVRNITFILRASVLFKICMGNTTIADYDVHKALQWELEDPESHFTFLVAGGSRDSEVMAKYMPHMVSIRSRNPQKYFGDNHFCAGTIFGKDLVLTTAHCVMDKRRVLTEPRRLLVVAGTPNRLRHTNTTVQFPVRSLTANTNFIRRNLDDIAIIRLKHEIPENNENIRILKLPQGPAPYGMYCTILGWGRLCRNGPLPALATHLEVRLNSPEECQQYLPHKMKRGVLCAGEIRPFKEGPCRGDSGGPLICNDTLTGIISWTIGCGSIRAVSLYTDVWYHRQWIRDNMNKGPCVDTSYSEISKYRPLRRGEKDLRDPRDSADFIQRHNITLYISSGFRPKHLYLDRCLVSIRTSQPTAYFGDNHFCAGVIITSRIIITAAHCVVDGQSVVTRPKRLRVVAGSSYRLKKEQTTLEFTVSKVIPHLKFKRLKGYDIALLVLSDAIPRSNTKIKIISLATTKPEVGTQCYTLGWGQLFWDGPYADRVIYGNLSIAENTLCESAYGEHFTSDLFCAANPMDPFVDTCRGDSGAPLICQKKLVGIASFSSMCSGMLPTTFTDVTQFNKWILDMGRGPLIAPSICVMLVTSYSYWIFA